MLKALLTFFCSIILIFIACKEVSSDNDLSWISYNPQAYLFDYPAGLPKLELPPDNPSTIEGVKLGQALFFDPILSRDSSMSCATCHQPALSFTDGKAFSEGIDGLKTRRSSMSLVNVAYYRDGLFWDGRVKTLEEQALIPVEDTVELHNTWDNVVAKLKTHPTYPVQFRKAFGILKKEEINKFLVAKAIAQYERTLISVDSKFDQVNREELEFTEDEAAGYDMFFDVTDNYPDAECGHCHNVPLLTTNEYFNNGITDSKMFEGLADRGVGAITDLSIDDGKFRAPTLRNIELTAPYMHDGRFQTLEEVLQHYSSGGQSGEHVSPLIRPLNLNKTEKRQLIAFLKTLTDAKFVEHTQQTSPKSY